MIFKYRNIIAFGAIIVGSLLIGCEETAILAKNTQRMDLYGKVIDQDGQPVVGAQAKGSIVLAVSLTSSENKDVATETNTAGRFQFVDLHGIGFGVTLQKAGYEFNGKPNWSADHEGDPGNPVVFTMWRLKGPEPMLHAKFGDWIPYDGTPVGINLFTGKKDAAGDLKIALVRNPVQIVPGGAPFDWNVKIEIVGGGLIKSHDIYSYEAPENGYQGIFEFSESKNDSRWNPRFLGTFYLRTSKGDYGRVTIDLATDSDMSEGTGLRVEAYMNPSGSRNLEWDSAKQIKPSTK